MHRYKMLILIEDGEWLHETPRNVGREHGNWDMCRRLLSRLKALMSSAEANVTLR